MQAGHMFQDMRVGMKNSSVKTPDKKDHIC